MIESYCSVVGRGRPVRWGEQRTEQVGGRRLRKVRRRGLQQNDIKLLQNNKTGGYYTFASYDHLNRLTSIITFAKIYCPVPILKEDKLFLVSSSLKSFRIGKDFISRNTL